MYVTKRNGDQQEFDVQKIKEVISDACAGLDVNPLKLESKIDHLVFDGITTEDIHSNVIEHAKQLCVPKEPDWVYVAGRLETMRMWKETAAYDVDFLTFFKEKLNNGEYAKHLFDYSDEEIMLLGDVIKQNYDLAHSYASVITAKDKYLQEGECIQQMFMATAMAIANIETKDKVDRAKEIYLALSERKISLATPWLINLRSGGNISSCFIISVKDDIDSIFDNVKQSAKISKMGGGLGIDLSNIRAKGATVNGVKNAGQGVTSWIKIFNDTAVAVNQNGKRSGAFTVALPIWHNDITDFLELQTEHGDPRKKSFDVFPQIVTHDLFLEQVKIGGNWYTFCPDELRCKGVKITQTYDKEFEEVYRKAVNMYKQGDLEIVTEHKAKDLLKQIMRVQFETGLPYIFFVDEVNRQNPNKRNGFIPCGNLCQESYSNVKADELTHCCNLASIVAGRMENLEDVIKYSSLCVRILDNGISLTNPPTDQTKAHNDLYRTVGVGVQGLMDYLVKHNKNYHHIDFIEDFFEAVEFGCVKESIQLAEERGSFPLFDTSKWLDKVEHFIGVGKLPWASLYPEMVMNGIRNSQLTSPAPNTSTSIFMDASAGVMPTYSPFFYESNKSANIPVAAMYVKEYPLAYSYSFNHYDQTVLAKAVGSMQKWVDTGISSEYVLDQNKENFSAKDLYDLIMSAYHNKTKAIYYVRTIKKGQGVDNLLGIDTSCVGCDG